MGGGVAPQVPPRREGLAAERAAELPAVSVDAHVDLQRAGLGEALPAVDAAEALLSRVDALVALQVAGVGEAFPAERADERLLARVDPHVGLQVLEAGQSLPAAAADERLPPGGVPADPVLETPPVPADERALSSRGSSRVTPLAAAESEAAARVVPCGVQSRGAGGLLGDVLEVEQQSVSSLAAQGVLGGGGADPTAVLVPRRFLFDLRGRRVHLRRLSLSNTTKPPCGRNQPVTNRAKPNDCGNHGNAYGPAPTGTRTRHRPHRPPL